MTLLEIAFYSWLCFFWGECAPGFEYTACTIEWTDHSGVSFAEPDCYVGPVAEPPLLPTPTAEKEDDDRNRKPRRSRRPWRLLRLGSR